MQMHKLTIAYRIYPKVSKRPPIFADDKYALSELCLSSLICSLDNTIDYIFIALLDNCPKEYEELFQKYIPENRLQLLNLPGIGNAGTFIKQIDLLLNQNHSEFVYFAEDDYFYLPGQFASMLDFMTNHNDVDFITPYDHLDNYTLELHDYKSEIRISSNKHWQNIATTCLTFLAKKQSLLKAQNIFKSYAKRNYDASIWLTITKMNAFNFRLVFKHLFNAIFKKSKFDFVFSLIYFKTYRFGLGRLFFSKSMKLWSPMPSIATHMEDNYLAPNIDWISKFEKKA